MNSMAAALQKANVTGTDFEAREINEKEIEFDMQIEFLEKWLKLVERNASEKEKHNFVTKHGFVSIKQFSMYLACSNDVGDLKYQLEDMRYYLPAKEISKLEKEIAEKESMAVAIKDVIYYKNILRALGQSDVTPYGEVIVKARKY